MKPHNKKILLRVIFPLSLGAIIVFVLLQVVIFAQADKIPGTPTPTDPILASLQSQIKQYDQDLKNNLSVEVKKSIEAKKKYLEQQATERANYLAHQDEALKIKETAIINATLTPLVPSLQDDMPVVAGGLYTEFGNPKSREAIFSTLWIVHTEKTYVLYYAGRMVSNPDQGVLYVENRKDGTGEMIYTPRKDGSLKIKNVINNRIDLDSKKGQKYIFNMDKKKFVNELDEPLPEVTPTPVPAYPSP